MKKSLIALAALSAFATAAQAQSSVTVYGVIDTGYNSVENTTSAGVKTTTNQIRTNGEGATSRFGVRGSEDLGGGLKANFVVEMGIGNTNANNTASFTNFGDRAFWAGIESKDMGELRIGFQDTVTRSNWLAHDQLAAANVAGNLAHDQAGPANGSSSTATNLAAGSHTGRSTAINYLSPRFNGAQLVLGLTQSEVDETGKAKVKTGSGSQAGLNYVAGKFSAGFAYAEATSATNVASNPTVTINPSNTCTNGTATQLHSGSAVIANAFACVVPSVATNVKTKDTSAAASYDFGVAKVAYIYNKRELNNSVTNSDWATNVDRTSNSFSASVPVGAKTVLRAGYGFGELRQGAASNYNADIKGMQAAVNYNLSKRTMAYAIYGEETREINATSKAKNQEYSVGVRHAF